MEVRAIPRLLASTALVLILGLALRCSIEDPPSQRRLPFPAGSGFTALAAAAPYGGGKAVLRAWVRDSLDAAVDSIPPAPDSTGAPAPAPPVDRAAPKPSPEPESPTVSGDDALPPDPTASGAAASPPDTTTGSGASLRSERRAAQEDTAAAETASALEQSADSGAASVPAPEPGAESPLGLLVDTEVRDTFGLLAKWRASTADTAHLQPLDFWPAIDPLQDALLYRLRQRSRARYYVRDERQLRPDYFLSADSLIAAADQQADSLAELGLAEGLLYRAVPSGGLRFLPPPVPWLTKRQIRTRQHDVDLDRQRIDRSILHNGEEVEDLPVESYGEYLARLSWVQAREQWHEEIARSMEEATVAGGRAGLVRISLPFEMPTAVKSIFGEGKPNLSVSGSERISFGGRSQWFPHRPNYEFQRQPSKFPQLEMKQDLNIRLKGTIGDKLDVDVDQSSQAQTSLANRIQIHYQGYEDEIIQKVDLGNTSLRLPGTEYVSYGGAHTGLFGINAEAQLGGVTLNMIVSKEEGETGEKSSSIRSEERQKTIQDYEFVKDRFFFIDDPTRDAYPEDPSVYIAQILEGTVLLYLDDGDGDAQETEFLPQKGYGVLNLDGPTPAAGDTVTSEPYYFEQLEYGTDFTVLIDERNQTHPILIINRYLDPDMTLGVVYYDQYRQESVGGAGVDSTGDDVIYVKMIRPRYDLVDSDLNSGPWGATNRLMLKNVYPLHQSLENWTGAGLPENAILEDGFELSVHYRGTIDGVEDPDEINSTRLIRYLGLDYYEETDTGLARGQDGQVDDVWVDFRNGYIFFPDLQPFAPEADGRLDLRGRPGDPSEWDVLPAELWNEDIYEARSCIRDKDLPGQDTTWTSRYYIEVKYRLPVTELTIPAWEIIEGSEVVTVGGRRLARDRDYRIDYQTGTITLLDEAGISEDEEIRVTYKHAGGFGTVSKTLLGAAMRYQPEDSDFAFSTSWLYERKGSPDRRPRLGSEPTRIAVGEVAARYGRESMGLTRLLDRLPFLDVRQPSRLSFEGGLGISFPNPNTRGDLYLDDFEGVADDVYVQLSRRKWKPTGVPSGVTGIDESERTARRGELWWYSPYRAVREGDLNPALDYQEANDYRSLLELQFWPYDGELVEGSGVRIDPRESWGGIVQGLSTTHLDMTRARFIDIWINDFVPWEEYVADTTLRSGTLYVELGQVSEDALWTKRPVDCATGSVQGGPIEIANRALDTEDANRDGELDLSDATNEDSGLDNILADDPADSTYDDFAWDGDSETRYEEYEDLCRYYANINGAERNGWLNTEDLDGDNWLDQDNSYFQFKIDLADTSFVETDVRRDYADQETNWTLAANNGWRRIRIPLSQAYVNDRVGDPAWDEVKHIRLWFEGMDSWKRVQIASIEVRSNRWVVEAVRDSAGEELSADELAALQEDFFPGVYNNKENSDIYYPPFEEHRDRDRDNVKEREQSLTLEMRNFQPGHEGRVYMPFLRDQDYMGYETLEFWLNSTLPMENEAEFYVRLCKDADIDTTDYYEYRVPVPLIPQADRQTGDWLPVEIRLTDLSGLKAIPGADSLVVTRDLPAGGQIEMKGNPYLTKIRRITFGVRNTGSLPIADANVWIDELRLTNVRRESDVAYRMQVRADLADVGYVDFSYKHVGDEFVSIGGGGFSQRREKETRWSLSAKSIPIDRFLPRALGLRMPFGYETSHSRRVPKYRTNSDLLVGENPTDRDISETVTRRYNLSLKREPARGGWRKYTIDAFSFSGSISQDFRRSPQTQDSTVTRSFSGSFSFPFGQMGEIDLYKGWTLRLLPTSFSVGLSRSEKDQLRYRRENGDIDQPFVLDQDRTIRSGGLTIATGLKPLQQINYSFSQNRNLMLREEAAWLGGLNIGQETSRQEDLTASYNLRVKRDWFEPRLSYRGSFRGTFNQQGTTGGGDLERYTDLTNNRTASATFGIPLERIIAGLATFGSGGGGEETEKEEETASEDGDPEEGRGPHNRGSLQRRSRSSRQTPLAGVIDIGRTNGSVSFNKRSTYSRVRGEPGIGYQLGLSMDPGVRRLDNARDTNSDGREFGVDTSVKLFKTVTITARFKDSEGETHSAGTLTGTEERTLPDLDIRWGNLHQSLGFRKYIRSFNASTRYSHNERTSLLSKEPTRIETRTNWSPLIDINMSLTSGLTTNVRLDRNKTVTEDLSSLASTGASRSEHMTTRLTFAAKRSFRLSREVVVPITNEVKRISTKLDLSLTVNLDRMKRVTYEPGQEPFIAGDTRKFDFDLAGAYQFSRSVNGRVSLSFGENADYKNKTRTSRYVGLQVSASFSF